MSETISPKTTIAQYTIVSKICESGIYHECDVSPDGQHFLIGTLIGDTKAAAPTVIMNWTALVRK